ncbi:hypothetical protein JXI42_10880 [bacterium]|nr:hypothetical protein [bacterium]
MHKVFFVFFIIIFSAAGVFSQIETLPKLPKTNVDIPWTELRELIELSMKKDSTILIPPLEYMIPSADYRAGITGNRVNGTVNLTIVVLKHGYVDIPLFDLSLPLHSPKLNGLSAPITPRGSKNSLILKGPGEFAFTAGFVIQLAEHTTNFRLNIPRSSTTWFQLTIPGTNLDVKLTPGSSIAKQTLPGKTVVEAHLSSTDYIFCEWFESLPEEAEEEVEPVLYSEAQILYSVGEGMVKGSAVMSYSVVQGKVDVVRFRIPKDVRILNVNTSNQRDWKMEEEEGGKIVSCYLKFPSDGTINVTCNYEHTMEAVSATVNLPVLECLGVEREKGYIGVEATTNVEISLMSDALDVASRVDRSELPQNLWGRASHPIILAFKYLQTPYIIPIDVEKHEDLPVKVATADNAAFVAMLTRDGNYIVRGTYNVRNNLKQFLALRLPDNAELWSLFVNGKPAKPGKGDKDIVLIPMEKSKGGGESTTFPVEVVYFVKGKKLRCVGGREVTMPKVDVPVSVMNLSLYLPNGYSYTGFGGNMEEATYELTYGDSRGAGGVFDMESNVPPMAAKSQRAAGMEEMLEAQVEYEKDMVSTAQRFSSTETGVFPVRISIPQVGTQRRFQKYVLPEDEKAPFPQVKVKFTKKGVKNALTFIVIILSILAFLHFSKLVIRFIHRIIDKKNKIVSAGIRALIAAFIEILILTWIAGLFAVSSLSISLTWFFGAIILVIYLVIKFLIKGLLKKTRKENEEEPRFPEEN